MTTLIGQAFQKKGKQSCIANASVIDYDADKKDPLARKAINQALDILEQSKKIDLKPTKEPDINIFTM